MSRFNPSNIKKLIFRATITLTFAFGLSFFLLLLISSTSLPYWGIYHLAVSQSDFSYTPETIVIMGGSGVPSKSALIRTYHASVLARKYPSANIIIALPDNLIKTSSHLLKMENELRIRSVTSQVIFEPKGTNTRSQALNIKNLLKGDINKKLLIVSSPVHMYRAILSFKKIGFRNVGGAPAFETDITYSLSFDSEKIGGKKYLPELGGNNQLRYQFWNHIKYEITLLREYSAIAYYKLQDWI